MKNKIQAGLFGFIYKNKVTIALIFVLFALLKQNIFDNNFPNVVFEREKSIEQIRLTNSNLASENTILESKIQSYTEEDLNLIESKARFKYGLIKEGEHFFKVNRIVETEASTENDKATL
jgi:cell division protein FtsB